MTGKICCIFNLAPHYRAPIFKLMDKELGCDFYFGDTLNNKIKSIDYTTLRGFKKVLKNKDLNFYGYKWQKGVWPLIFKPYTHFIITGDPSVLSSWVLVVLGRISGKKVYAWTHGLKKPVETKGDIVKKTFYRLCYKILLYGDYSKNIMLNEGFEENKLIPIYNSLDYDLQLKIRRKLKENTVFKNHFDNAQPTIIYIGRIQKSKKLDLLIQAVYQMKLENIICNLVFVGSDVENNNLPDLVKEHNLEKFVWFYGPCYDEAIIANMLYNADVCVSPGPVGLTALHALTYGCPVISNDDFQNQMPEHGAITIGKTGDFFKNDNVKSLTEVIKNWVALPCEDREVIRKIAFETIDSKWNPSFQINTLKKLLL